MRISDWSSDVCSSDLAKRRELHFPIAQHVRVRRLAGRVVGQKTCEYALTVFAREVDAMQRNIELVADRARILEIVGRCAVALFVRSEEHTSELQSLMRNSYAVFCLKKKKKNVTKAIKQYIKKCYKQINKTTRKTK